MASASFLGGFVVAGIGAALLNVGVGMIVFGAGLALFGYLLGQE